MKNKKGFTLIELLAVIVILAVLLGIAIPKVSQYITNSRKDSFVSQAKYIVDSVRNDATSLMFPFPIQNNDITIVTLDLVSLKDSDNKTSFGGTYLYNKSYVAIINIGTGVDPEYKYFFAAQDSKGYAIPLLEEKEITTDKIIAKAKNKMEVTIQSLCGTKEGYARSYSTISGLDKYQPVDENGNKISWNATIFSKEGCVGNE